MSVSANVLCVTYVHVNVCVGVRECVCVCVRMCICMCIVPDPLICQRAKSLDFPFGSLSIIVDRPKPVCV